MNAADVIAFTADADTWCPDCAREVYGAAACGRCPECNSFLYPAVDRGVCEHCERDYSADNLTDNERNEVYPIFADSWSSWEDSGLYCRKCHEEIIPRSKA